MIHNYPRIIRKKIMRTFEFSNELVSIQLNLRFFIAHTRLPGDVSQKYLIKEFYHAMRTLEFLYEPVSIQLNLRFSIAHTRLPGDVSQQISEKRILSRQQVAPA